MFMRVLLPKIVDLPKRSLDGGRLAANAILVDLYAAHTALELPIGARFGDLAQTPG